MIDSSFFKARRGWAAAMVLMASAATCTVSQAETTYTLSGEFTSFRTWLPTGYDTPAAVGGVALIDSGQFAGTYLGQLHNWSQTVLLRADTTTIDFTYVAVAPDTSVYNANNFSFAAGTDVTVDPGVPFTMGSISFTNGQWLYRTEMGVHFSATSVADGTVNEFDDTLVLLSNSPYPPYTPREQADYFYLLGHPELGSVRVFDSFSQPADNPGSTGTVDFIAQIGSLDPLAFRATNSAAFVSGSIVPDPNSVVPEPSTWAMLIIGLLVTTTLALRRTGPHAIALCLAGAGSVVAAQTATDRVAGIQLYPGASSRDVEGSENTIKASGYSIGVCRHTTDSLAKVMAFYRNDKLLTSMGKPINGSAGFYNKAGDSMSINSPWMNPKTLQMASGTMICIASKGTR